MTTPSPAPPLWGERAAQLLITPAALMQLTLGEAQRIAAYMQPELIVSGTTFMREGDETGNDHLLLVLDGEVQIKSQEPAGQGDGVVVRVVGEGSLLGELGLLDGQPRSANCIALTDLQVAKLCRADFMRLLDEEPRLGNRLLLAVASRTADRLREITTKFKLFVRMNKAMSAELQASVDRVAAQQGAAVPPTAPASADAGAVQGGGGDTGFGASRYIDWPEVT